MKMIFASILLLPSALTNFTSITICLLAAMKEEYRFALTAELHEKMSSNNSFKIFINN